MPVVTRSGQSLGRDRPPLGPARRPEACGRGRSEPPAAARRHPRSRRRRDPRSRPGRRVGRRADRPSHGVAPPPARPQPGRRSPAPSAGATTRRLRNLTIRRGFPGTRSAVTSRRPMSSKLSEVAVVCAGPSITWSIAAAIVRPLARVECSSITRGVMRAKELGLQRRRERRRGAGIGLGDRQLLVGDELRLHDHRCLTVERLDLVEDRLRPPAG